MFCSDFCATGEFGILSCVHTVKPLWGPAIGNPFLTPILRWLEFPPTASTALQPHCGFHNRLKPLSSVVGNVRNVQALRTRGMRLCVCENLGKTRTDLEGPAARCLTPQPHRVCQRITQHAPAHVWGWNPSTIMVAHVHFSVNTTIDILETHFGAL